MNHQQVGILYRETAVLNKNRIATLGFINGNIITMKNRVEKKLLTCMMRLKCTP